MKQIYNRDARIESHPWFPYIAWTLVLGFAFFVFHLSNLVNEKKLEIQTQINQNNFYTNPDAGSID